MTSLQLWRVQVEFRLGSGGEVTPSLESTLSRPGRHPGWTILPSLRYDIGWGEEEEGEGVRRKEGVREVENEGVNSASGQS